MILSSIKAFAHNVKMNLYTAYTNSICHTQFYVVPIFKTITED